MSSVKVDKSSMCSNLLSRDCRRSTAVPQITGIVVIQRILRRGAGCIRPPVEFSALPNKPTRRNIGSAIDPGNGESMVAVPIAARQTEISLEKWLGAKLRRRRQNETQLHTSSNEEQRFSSSVAQNMRSRVFNQTEVYKSDETKPHADDQIRCVVAEFVRCRYLQIRNNISVNARRRCWWKSWIVLVYALVKLTHIGE